MTLYGEMTRQNQTKHLHLNTSRPMNLMNPMNHKIASLANQSIAYWENSMVKYFFGIHLLKNPQSGGVQILEEFQKCICVKLKFQEES